MGESPFELFNTDAARALELAEVEARQLSQHWLGTEHILLGILAEENGLGARVLNDIDPDEVRAEVLRVCGTGEKDFVGQIPFTPRAFAVIKHALREAVRMGDAVRVEDVRIGTEHLLLGLTDERQGVAMQILEARDCSRDRILNEILRLSD